jgi:hypothetical protein
MISAVCVRRNQKGIFHVRAFVPLISADAAVWLVATVSLSAAGATATWMASYGWACWARVPYLLYFRLIHNIGAAHRSWSMSSRSSAWRWG